jgi:hypothetical protein
MIHIEPITVAVIIGFIIGLTVGTIITGLTLTERRSARHWVVSLRLPEDLHHRLSEAATVAGCSLKAEIIKPLAGELPMI